jgi:hypothetical protein
VSSTPGVAKTIREIAYALIVRSEKQKSFDTLKAAKNLSDRLKAGGLR